MQQLIVFSYCINICTYHHQIMVPLMAYRYLLFYSSATKRISQQTIVSTVPVRALFLNIRISSYNIYPRTTTKCFCYTPIGAFVLYLLVVQILGKSLRIRIYLNEEKRDFDIHVISPLT